MEENNIEWRARGEIEFNIKSNLNKKLSVRQAVLYTFGQDCRFIPYLLIPIHLRQLTSYLQIRVFDHF